MEYRNNHININFAYRGHGWIILKIGFPSSELTIHLSSCFDPFPELIRWLEEISSNNLPSDCIIDEEGYGKRFVAQKSSKDKKLFQFKIYEWDWGSEEQTVNEKELFVSEIEITQFLDQFVNALTDFIYKNKGLEWDSRYRLIELSFDSITNKTRNV